MTKLEQEFNELITGIYTEIRRKQVAGELTRDEADALTDMVTNHVSYPDSDDEWCASHSSRGWSSSSC